MILTFELIGKLVVGTFTVALLGGIIWYLVDYLPLKIISIVDSQKIFWEYLYNRQSFKKWLKERKQNSNKL